MSLLIHHRIQRQIIAWTAGAMVVSQVQADTITLRSHVMVAERDSKIRLAQVAELDGAAAEDLADVVVFCDAGGVDHRLTVQAVRDELTQAGAHWGRINLQGSAVMIQVMGQAEASPAAMTPAALSPAQREGTAKEDEHSQVSLLAESIIDESTLRGELARLFCSKLNVTPGNLKLAVASADEPVLEQSLEGARFEIQPTSALGADRVTAVVRKWVDNAIVESWNITVHPTIKMQAAFATIDFRKRHTIAANDVEVTETWLPGGAARALASCDEIIGRIATTHVNRGDLLRRTDIERQTIVQRGERVMVRCLVGGSVIAMQAEARSDGGQGDVIELRKSGERDTFFATVTGPREVIIDLARPIHRPVNDSIDDRNSQTAEREAMSSSITPNSEMN